MLKPLPWVRCSKCGRLTMYNRPCIFCGHHPYTDQTLSDIRIVAFLILLLMINVAWMLVGIEVI